MTKMGADGAGKLINLSSEEKGPVAFESFQPLGRQMRFVFEDEESATEPRWVEVNTAGVRVENLRQFGGPWLAGAAFTAADAFYAPVAFRVRTYGLDVGAGQAWVERVIAHPAMQDWEAQALAETWREESHEAELAEAGTITADYRQS